MIVEPCLPLKGSNTSQRGREMREKTWEGSGREGRKEEGKKGKGVYVWGREKCENTYSR